MLEREKQRLQEAREYYNRSLLIKYGIWAFAKNIERNRMLEDAADSQRAKWVMKNGLKCMKAGVEESKLEERRREQRMEYIAIRYWER